MKFIFLIRHAKSSWDAALTDFERPLNARGLRDADKMAMRLSEKIIPPIEIFISSPAKRAKATAEKFAAVFGKDKHQIIFDQDLYLAPVSFFDQLIGKIDDSFAAAAIFSHNPGITDFVNTLGLPVKTDNVPTCGIFAVKANIDSWKNFAAAGKEFLFYDYPKLHA